MQTNLLKVLTTKKEQLAGDRLVIVDSTVYMTLIFVAVVLLLHHVNYTTDYLWEVTHRFFNPYEIRIDKLLQKFAVGGFLLLSGYKLSISKLSEPAGQFLINRIKRIYPLYLIAIWVFSFSAYPYLAGEMPSRPNLMVHILGLQSVFPNLFQTNFLTIWFVSTLFCCYLLFLWLRKYLRRSSAFLIRVALFLVATALIRQIAGTYNIAAFTEDFDTYTLFFCSGMLCAQHRDRLARITRMNKWALAGTSIVSTVLLVAFRIYHPDNSLFGSAAVGYLFNIVAILGSVLPVHLLLLTAGSKLKVRSKVARLMGKMTAASYCVFLFHRPIWTALAQLWNQPSYLQSIFILGFGIPLIFVVSYWAQTFYSQAVLSRRRIRTGL